MKFFEGQRPQIYIHGAKLRRDKKSGKRIWGLVLIVTATPELMKSCGPEIERAWNYIRELDNGTVDMSLAGIICGATIDFFARIDDATPVLHLQGVDLKGLRFTRDGNVVEFWFQGEHENNAGLHAFVKEYAFTRCWAQFSPRQGELQMKPAARSRLHISKG